MFLIPYIGIFFSAAAIVLAAVQMKKNKTGMATAGLVIGIIGAVSNFVWLMIVLITLSFMGI